MPLTTVSTGSPVKVTGTTSADTVIFAKQAYVKFIYWYQPTTVGHLLSVKQSDGSEVVIAYCESANESQWLPVFQTCGGIHIDDMDSGSVYIYI